MKVIVLSEIEETLLKIGFDSMGSSDRNRLISTIARKENKSFDQIANSAYLLQYHKDLKTNLLSAKCDDVISEGYVAGVNGNTYRTNFNDIFYMMGQKLELVYNTEITKILWKTMNAGYVNHTREEWLAVYKEGYLRVKYFLFRYDQLATLIQTCENHEDIVGITWDTEVNIPEEEE